MVSTVTTQEDLNNILQAASDGVQTIYRRFRKQFPNRQMKEVGLTDIFMMLAQENAPKGVKFELLSDEEKLNGADFQVTLNGEKKIFFQAKVAKQKSGETYANFIYESKRDGSLNYQNVLLAEYAKANKTSAYYVIYDDKAVRWVNALALGNWIMTSKTSGEDPKVNVAAFKELARASYTEARKDPWVASL